MGKNSGGIDVYNTTTHEFIGEMKYSNAIIYSLALGNSGQSLFAGQNNGVIALYDPISLSYSREFARVSQIVESLAISPINMAIK